MPQPGDLCIVFQGEKLRKAVVMKITSSDPDERVVALAGTKTPPRDGQRHVEISHRERTGILLLLDYPTFFYASGVAIARVSSLQLLPGRCTPERFIELCALIGL